MSVEQRDPAVCDGSNNMGGKGEMTKAPDILQDLRRNLYVKAKAEPTWRFWGLYVHVCKTETIYEAYERARSTNGAPGIDGVTFEAIEESGVESFLEQIRDELVSNTYRPMRARKKEIPKDGGKKVRVLIDMAFAELVSDQVQLPGNHYSPSDDGSFDIDVPVKGTLDDLQTTYKRFLVRTSGKGVDTYTHPSMIDTRRYGMEGERRNPVVRFRLLDEDCEATKSVPWAHCMKVAGWLRHEAA